MLRSGEVRLLDVVTELNDKEVSPFTYLDETKKASCSLLLNRSIALPRIHDLMEKGSFYKSKYSINFCALISAKVLKPTHIVAVLNPKDVPNCSTEKGFGLEVMVREPHNSFY